MDVLAPHSTREIQLRLLAKALEVAEGGGDVRMLVDPSHLSGDKIREEFDRALRVLHPEIVRRVHLELVEPQNRNLITLRPQPYYETAKILMGCFLARTPITVGSLAEKVGISYSTLRRVLRRLLKVEKVGRFVRFEEFPTRLMREMTVLSETVRRPFRFKSLKPELDGLVTMISRAAIPHVAFSGVIGGRRLDKHFDLNGLPVVHLVAHFPDGEVDLEFVEHLDPALKETKSDNPDLVVVPLVRAWSGFSDGVAHPIDVALDLCSIGMGNQADAMLKAIRHAQS